MRLVGTTSDEWFHGSVVSGSSGLLALGALWAALAGLDVLAQRGVGLNMGTAIALSGAQYLVSSDTAAWGYGATLTVAAMCFAGFLVQRSPVLLIAGVLGVTQAVSEAVLDWTSGALSASLIVLHVGAILLRVPAQAPQRTVDCG